MSAKPHAFVLTLALAAIAACANDPLRPEEVAGAYALTSVEGEPPPAAVLETTEAVVFVTGGSLSLTEVRGYELEVLFETRTGDPGDIPVQTTFRDTGRFELRSDEGIVFFSSVSQGNRAGSATGARVALSLPVPGASEERVQLSFRK